MTQRLLRRRRLDLVERPGAERSAGRGEDDALDVFTAPGAERLEHRVMLAVDRQHRGAGTRRAAHEERTGTDETFLVGQGNGRAALDRRQRRFQTGRAADRRHHPIGRTLRRFDQSALARGGFDAATGQRRFKFVVAIGIRNDGELRADIARNASESPHIAVRADGFNAITVRFAPDEIDGAGADRTRDAENGDAARRRCRFGRQTCELGWRHTLTIPEGRGPEHRSRRAPHR